MEEFLHGSLLAFIRLFVAIDAIGVLPIFHGLTAGTEATHRSRIARRAIVTASAVGVAFFIAGRQLFRLLHITENDFRVGGGLILLVLAISDLLFASDERRRPAGDIGVVPIGVPLIIGPAALTTLLVLAQVYGAAATLLALAANMLVVALVFRCAERIIGMIHLDGIRAVSKITSLLLAAVAVMMVRLGISGMLGISE